MSTAHIDRLSPRRRPDGSPVMVQGWRKLLFMHWPIPAELLRTLLPDNLMIDTYDGTAWIGITPFTVRDARPPFIPPVPWLSDFHEINVRTYVLLDGVPGVWFFSLDAASLAAVLGARMVFHLPYHHADMSLEQQDATIIYSSDRKDDAPPAKFRATWRIGEHIGHAEPGSLEFFLIERYCLYTVDDGTLYRARIHHAPWPLQRVELAAFESTMLEAQGLPTPAADPLLHYSEGVEAEIWALEKV